MTNALLRKRRRYATVGTYHADKAHRNARGAAVMRRLVYFMNRSSAALFNPIIVMVDPEPLWRGPMKFVTDERDRDGYATAINI